MRWHSEPGPSVGAFRERAKSWRSWRHHSCKIGDDAVPFAGLGLDRRNELAVTVLVFVPKGPCRSVLGGRAEKEEEKCEGAESEQGRPRRAQAGPPDGVERPEDRLGDNHDPGGITGQDPVRVVLATDEREAREVVPVKGPKLVMGCPQQAATAARDVCLTLHKATNLPL